MDPPAENVGFGERRRKGGGARRGLRPVCAGRGFTQRPSISRYDEPQWNVCVCVYIVQYMIKVLYTESIPRVGVEEEEKKKEKRRLEISNSGSSIMRSLFCFSIYLFFGGGLLHPTHQGDTTTTTYHIHYDGMALGVEYIHIRGRGALFGYSSTHAHLARTHMHRRWGKKKQQQQQGI